MSVITEFFDICGCDDSIREGQDWISIVNPDYPAEEFNLRYRNNFEITSITGIHGLRPRDVTTENTSFSDGTTILGERFEQGEIEIKLRIDMRCPDPTCYRDELYKLIRGDVYGSDDCCFDGDEICFDRFELPDYTSTILRLRCEGKVRDFRVVSMGDIGLEQVGQYELYTIKFLAASPLNYHPGIQRYTIELEDEELFFPERICGSWNLDHPLSFEKEICIEYCGTEDIGPKIEIFGTVTNLEINSPTTCINLNRKGSYTISGCGPATLDFQPNRKTFTDPAGSSIANKLSKLCPTKFKLHEGLNHFTIKGESVDADNFRIEFTWFNHFHGFVGCKDDPEFDPSCAGDPKPTFTVIR